MVCSTTRLQRKSSEFGLEVMLLGLSGCLIHARTFSVPPGLDVLDFMGPLGMTGAYQCYGRRQMHTHLCLGMTAYFVSPSASCQSSSRER